MRKLTLFLLLFIWAFGLITLQQCGNSSPDSSDSSENYENEDEDEAQILYNVREGNPEDPFNSWYFRGDGATNDYEAVGLKKSINAAGFISFGGALGGICTYTDFGAEIDLPDTKGDVTLKITLKPPNQVEVILKEPDQFAALKQASSQKLVMLGIYTYEKPYN